MYMLILRAFALPGCITKFWTISSKSASVTSGFNTLNLTVVSNAVNESLFRSLVLILWSVLKLLSHSFDPIGKVVD